MSITSSASLRSAFVVRPSALTQAAVILGGSAFLAIMAQIVIHVPGSPVPITGQTLGALLLGTAYGTTLGLSTFATYLIVGIAGAPIFASGGHGFVRLTSATGGYLIGMLLATLITGLLADRKWDRKISTSVFTMLIGEIAIFSSGLIWLHHVTALTWAKTFSAGFYPFVPGEIIKIVIASTALPLAWRLVPSRHRG